MSRGIDILVTWPKTRTLESYLEVLRWAEINGEVINYRVSSPPIWDFGELSARPARCYMVHDGAVRGYNEIHEVVYRGEREVADPAGGGYWPEGWYVVRDPHWVALADPIPMRGFRGWRWWSEYWR